MNCKDENHTHELPAQYADSVQINMNADGANLSFGEAAPNPASGSILYHTRIKIPIRQVIPLRDILNQLIDNYIKAQQKGVEMITAAEQEAQTKKKS